MHSKLLGEVTVTLDEKEYKLKPTHKGFVLMEDLTGKTLSQLVKTFLSNTAGVKDVTGVIYAGMWGANGNKTQGLPSMDDVGEMVMRFGLLNLFPLCGNICGAVYTGKPLDELIANQEAMKAGVKKEAAPKEAPAEPKAEPAPAI